MEINKSGSAKIANRLQWYKDATGGRYAGKEMRASGVALCLTYFSIEIEGLGAALQSIPWESTKVTRLRIANILQRSMLRTLRPGVCLYTNKCFSHCLWKLNFTERPN